MIRTACCLALTLAVMPTAALAQGSVSIFGDRDRCLRIRRTRHYDHCHQRANSTRALDRL